MILKVLLKIRLQMRRIFSYSKMNSVKPWQPFSTQLEILKSRGLLVEDDDAALRYLARIGYYRLSGYWYPMRELDNTAAVLGKKTPIRLDKFVEGSRFEDAAKLYIFDAKLRLLALDAIERIELAVRVDVAYLLGKYDPCAHKKVKHLHGNFTKKRIKYGHDKGKAEHEVWLEKYAQQLKRSRRESFVEHHKHVYGGELPIWVAIEIWDFGMLSKLFAGMNVKDRDEIAKKYGVDNGSTFVQWLRSLNFIRNVSAHHSRLWNANVLDLSPAPAKWSAVPNNKPFLYFCFMQQILRVLSPNSSWSQRFFALLDEFPVSNNLTNNLADFGVVEGWETREIWK